MWKGNDLQLKAGFVDDFYVSIPKGQGSMLKAQLESLQPLIAPIGLQQPVGVLRLTFRDQPYGEYPVLALEPGRAWPTCSCAPGTACACCSNEFDGARTSAIRTAHMDFRSTRQHVAYLNGELPAAVEARIPVLDRGFIFGDGVYEVIPVYSRQPFRLEGHCSAWTAAWPASVCRIRTAHAQWSEIIAGLIGRSRVRGSKLVSAGDARRREARSRISPRTRRHRVSDDRTRCRLRMPRW